MNFASKLLDYVKQTHQGTFLWNVVDRKLSVLPVIHLLKVKRVSFVCIDICVYLNVICVVCFCAEVSASQDSDVESSQSGSDALSVGTDKSSQSGLTGNGGALVEGTNTVLVSAVSVSGL